MTHHEIRTIAVIGAGLMGHGIAQEFALNGYAVRLHARTDESLSRATQRIRRNLSSLADDRRIDSEAVRSAMRNIGADTSLEKTVDRVDVVIESVFEDLALKRRLFRQLDRLCPEHTILATNTSSFLPSQLGSATSRPDRVIGAHYINPPHLIPLVEIIRGPETSDDTVATMSQLLRSAGKRPVVLQKEVPGFITGRLQAAVLREALWLVEQGIARPQDVDAALTGALGRRWAAAGVFEVGEIAGWDLFLAIASELFPKLASSPGIPRVLSERVGRGELGVKSGRGFYEWTPESAAAAREQIASGLSAIEDWSRTSETD